MKKNIKEGLKLVLFIPISAGITFLMIHYGQLGFTFSVLFTAFLAVGYIGTFFSKKGKKTYQTKKTKIVWNA
jgi:hypothetical protein